PDDLHRLVTARHEPEIPCAAALEELELELSPSIFSDDREADRTSKRRIEDLKLHLADVFCTAADRHGPRRLTAHVDLLRPIDTDRHSVRSCVDDRRLQCSA